MKPLIPVTLVTGFLGAGKTTLLQHILNADTGLRFAIIENEFGDIGVDGALVDARSDNVFELNDGCVCCTVREDLIETFEQILQRRNEFDHIIIETTGLAEPGPVMRLFERPAIRASFALNGVVTVVDARHLEQSLADVTACAEQITYADLLILNKVDLVSPSVTTSLEAQLKELNPLATITHATHAKVDVTQLLELSQERAADALASHHNDRHHPHEHHDNAHHDHDHEHHDHDHHVHDESIRPAVVEAAGNVDIDALDLWLGALARSEEQVLLRMKGIVAVKESPRRFVFNGVRSVVDVRPDRTWEHEPRYCRIVFIGRGLDADTLQSQFNGFMSDA